MEGFAQKLIVVFFTACGTLLGAALIGALGAALVREPPIATMLKLAQEIKIWAIVAAIGGTFSTFEAFESGLFQGEIKAVVRQFCYVLSSLAGAQLSYFVILTLTGGNK
ncbi:MAG: YtrH family sporulation protein [Peptococcaceae bacterium]|nr:YtrH family sporulation protein [Peptococcaceae bacterium]